MHWSHQGVTNATGRPSLMVRLVQDGALYFGFIFSMNLIWVIMLLHAPTNLRSISALPSTCVNVVMVCRISLSLRATVHGPTTFERTRNNIPMGHLTGARSRRSTQAFNLTATQNLQVHIRKDCHQSKDFGHVQFTDSDVSITHQRPADEV